MSCPECNISYDDFRTGLTYADVYAIIYERKHKRRNGVLGKWHEIKQTMWADHLETCGAEELGELERIDEY